MSGSPAPDRPDDLRTSRRRDLGVTITRDLGGDGRLVRGSRTGYSTLRFSSGGAAAPEEPQEKLQAAPDASPAASLPSDAGERSPPARDESPSGILERISKLFSRRNWS